MSDIISWDKAIDKKVKSSDDKDLGKVRSITQDYIQTKEGTIGKKYYYIPKYYLQGYDGDHLWVSLTKDEVKSRFEGEKEPSTIETPEYLQRKADVAKQHPNFESNIPTYSGVSAVSSPIATTETSSTIPTSTSTPTIPDAVAMPWDKIIDRKVKSTDNEDLGKVESVAVNYVEVKEGAVHKKHYFIPKYYIQGFDGENLRTSLTKSETKDRYERDNPPTESEFQSQEYMEHKRKVDSTYPQFLHGIPFMAKEPGVALQTEQSGETLTIPWEEVIHKHVRASDNEDIGDVERVGNEFIVVRQGVAKIHLYYIPKSYINRYDGSSLWISVPSGLISAKFERDNEPTPEEIRMLAEEDAASRRGGAK
ncbi:MAG TPA: hypothetical protein VIR31_06365 [Nitrososphaeraceae archaeon]